MNRYLLDTNVVSELRKPRPHGGVVAWLNNQEEHQLFLSAVTMGELQAGIERTRRQDPSKASDIESWADQRSEEHTSELQSLAYLVCRLLLEKKKNRRD